VLILGSARAGRRALLASLADDLAAGLHHLAEQPERAWPFEFDLRTSTKDTRA
jgi:hypothetical protein